MAQAALAEVIKYSCVEWMSCFIGKLGIKQLVKLILSTYASMLSYVVAQTTRLASKDGSAEVASVCHFQYFIQSLANHFRTPCGWKRDCSASNSQP